MGPDATQWIELPAHGEAREDCVLELVLRQYCVFRADTGRLAVFQVGPDDLLVRMVRPDLSTRYMVTTVDKAATRIARRLRSTIPTEAAALWTMLCPAEADEADSCHREAVLCRLGAFAGNLFPPSQAHRQSAAAEDDPQPRAGQTQPNTSESPGSVALSVWNRPGSSYRAAMSARPDSRPGSQRRAPSAVRESRTTDSCSMERAGSAGRFVLHACVKDRVLLSAAKLRNSDGTATWAVLLSGLRAPFREVRLHGSSDQKLSNILEGLPAVTWELLRGTSFHSKSQNLAET